MDESYSVEQEMLCYHKLAVFDMAGDMRDKRVKEASCWGRRRDEEAGRPKVAIENAKPVSGGSGVRTRRSRFSMLIE